MFSLSRSIILPKGACDVVKLVAALLVVTSHIGSVALGPAYNSTHPAFYILASQNGYIGVALFFFLSGFGLMESELRSKLSCLQFLRRRFLKIYFPVLLVTGLWLLLTHNLSRTREPIFYTLFWDFADPVLWFIRVLIPLYAVFFIGSLAANYIGWKKVAVLILIGCIAYSTYRQIYFDTIRDHSVPLFALGILCSLYKSNRLVGMSTLILIVGVIVSGFAMMTSHPYTNAIHSLFDYIFVILVVWTISIIQPNWHLSLWLSAILFDIYLIHFKFFTIASEVWQVPLWLFLVFSIPASFLLAYFFMKLRTAVAKALHI